MEREPRRSGDRLLSGSYWSIGIRFEFCALRQMEPSLRSWVRTKNLRDAGSSPAGSTIWVSRLAAMAADCKSAGFTIVGSSPTWPTKRKRAASLWKPPNIISIAQKQRECLFSFYQKSISFSYGTSHLENFSNRMYYEDTKKEWVQCTK